MGLWLQPVRGVVTVGPKSTRYFGGRRVQPPLSDSPQTNGPLNSRATWQHPCLATSGVT